MKPNNTQVDRPVDWVGVIGRALALLVSVSFVLVCVLILIARILAGG